MGARTMYGGKQMRERHDELIGAAMDLLLKTGAVRICEDHDEYEHDDMTDEGKEAAIRLGRERICQGTLDADPEEWARIVEEAYADVAFHCPGCERDD